MRGVPAGLRFPPGSQHYGDSFLEHSQAIGDSPLLGELGQPPGRFIHRLERQLEGAVMHRHEPLRLQILERLDGLIRPHVHVAESLREIGTDRQQGYLRAAKFADLLEAVEIGGVAGVENPPALVFQHESAIAAVFIVESSRAPVFARCHRDPPVASRKTLPPFQFDDALEAQIVRQFAHAPRHHSDPRMREAPQGRFVEVIEMGMCQQHKIDRRQMIQFQPRTLDPLQQEEPVRKVRIDQDIQIVELNEKRRMPNPRQGHLPGRQPGKLRTTMLPDASGQ